MGALRRLWEYARAYQRDFIFAVIYSTVNKLLDVTPELLIGVAIDVVVNKQNNTLYALGLTSVMSQLVAIAFLTIFVYSTESVTEYLQALTWRTAAQKLQHALRVDAYKHVQNLTMRALEQHTTGELSLILNEDINQIERFFYSGGNEFIHLTVGTIAIGAIFISISPIIAFIALTPIPIIILITFYFQRTLERHYRLVREKATHLASRITNNLQGILTIKSYVTQHFELDRIREKSEAYKQTNERAFVIGSAFTPIVRIAVVLGFMSTLLLGGWYTLTGKLAIGYYSILIAQTQRLLWPLTRLGELVDMYERTMSAAKRVLDIIALPIIPRDTGTRFNPHDIHGTIDFKSVSFGYEHERPIIDNFNLHIPTGSTVAFVGPSGCGKSTILRLLLRFYEPTHGTITIDGEPLQTLNIDDIRKAVAFVTQDVFLFHGTIRDNITYGSPHATKEDIERAARKAQAHDFIHQFPHGYDTLIHDHGYPLSGGQKQRLGIARALVKDAPIYILDEATSAIDNITEKAIQHELDETLRQRTRIVIAHRLTHIMTADLICVLDQGQIIQAGTHEELMQQEGTYRTLWTEGA